MAVGIQPGQEAGSAESKRLDGNVNRIACAIARAQSTYVYEQGHKNYGDTYLKETRDRVALPELVKRGVQIGCVPDGGMWFDGSRANPERKLRVVFEAKHQQDAGNAIERWATNHSLCQSINPEVVYVTFASGEGAQEGGVLHTYGESMRSIFPNTRWHYSECGFAPEEIFDIMRETLNLDLTYDQISRFIDTDSTYEDLFVELTPEEILADVARKQEIISAEEVAVTLIQQSGNPVNAAWHKLAGEDRAEARDIIIESVQAGLAPQQIAQTLLDTYV